MSETTDRDATSTWHWLNREILSNAAERRAFTDGLPTASVDSYHTLRSAVVSDPMDQAKRRRLSRFMRAHAGSSPDPEPVSFTSRSAWREEFLRLVESGTSVERATALVGPTPNQMAAAKRVPAFKRRFDAVARKVSDK